MRIQKKAWFLSVTLVLLIPVTFILKNEIGKREKEELPLIPLGRNKAIPFFKDFDFLEEGGNRSIQERRSLSKKNDHFSKPVKITLKKLENGKLTKVVGAEVKILFINAGTKEKIQEYLGKKKKKTVLPNELVRNFSKVFFSNSKGEVSIDLREVQGGSPAFVLLARKGQRSAYFENFGNKLKKNIILILRKRIPIQIQVRLKSGEPVKNVPISILFGEKTKEKSTREKPGKKAVSLMEKNSMIKPLGFTDSMGFLRIQDPSFLVHWANRWSGSTLVKFSPDFPCGLSRENLGWDDLKSKAVKRKIFLDCDAIQALEVRTKKLNGDPLPLNGTITIQDLDLSNSSKKRGSQWSQPFRKGAGRFPFVGMGKSYLISFQNPRVKIQRKIFLTRETRGDTALVNLFQKDLLVVKVFSSEGFLLKNLSLHSSPGNNRNNFLFSIQDTGERGEIYFPIRAVNEKIYLTSMDHRYSGVFTYLGKTFSPGSGKVNASLKVFLKKKKLRTTIILKNSNGELIKDAHFFPGGSTETIHQWSFLNKGGRYEFYGPPGADFPIVFCFCQGYQKINPKLKNSKEQTIILKRNYGFVCRAKMLPSSPNPLIGSVWIDREEQGSKKPKKSETFLKNDFFFQKFTWGSLPPHESELLFYNLLPPFTISRNRFTREQIRSGKPQVVDLTQKLKSAQIYAIDSKGHSISGKILVFLKEHGFLKKILRAVSLSPNQKIHIPTIPFVLIALHPEFGVAFGNQNLVNGRLLLRFQNYPLFRVNVLRKDVEQIIILPDGKYWNENRNIEIWNLHGSSFSSNKKKLKELVKFPLLFPRQTFTPQFPCKFKFYGILRHPRGKGKKIPLHAEPKPPWVPWNGSSPKSRKTIEIVLR